MSRRTGILCLLVTALAMGPVPSCVPQIRPTKHWAPAVYHGLTVGKSTRKDVLRVLGKPKSTGRAAESDPPMLSYGYDVADPVKGNIGIYFQGEIVDSMAVYPDTSITKEDVVRIFGQHYLLVRYSGENCLGSGGAGPMYEDPNGDIKHMEYRDKGIAVNFLYTEVEAILYVQRPFGPTRSPCAQQKGNK